MRKQMFLKVLTQSFLAGELEIDALVSRANHTLGQRWAWLGPLASRYKNAFRVGTRPRERDVIRFLSRDSGFTDAWSRHSRKLSIAHWLAGSQQMQPVEAARNWSLPALESAAVLAEWLGVDFSELEWFADCKNLNARHSASKLRHYHYTILAKQSGSLRLIEAPKARMKEIQRRILSGILENVPPHAAVHGFIEGRSIKSFVAPHVSQRVVLRLDLKDFFPSFSYARVQAVFRTLGYPDLISELLAGLCTTLTPKDVWSRSAFGEDPFHLWETRREIQDLYSRRHLPQGAPTSPALANICTYRLDCRLAGLARAAGATYTRYADDLAFSGNLEFEREVDRFAIHVGAILQEEGFRVHHRKTRIMRRGVRQHLAGLIANQKINVYRHDFDRLKAILTNCARLGPEMQNRENHPLFREHLAGRVGFVETINPQKGQRLRSIFDTIQWPA